MIYFPFFGALALGAGIVLEKIILRKRKIGIEQYQVAGFLAIILVMLPFVYFFWSVSSEALKLKNAIIFLFVILFSLFANFFTFYSVKWAKISNIEPAKMLEPIFTIFLAVIFSFVFGEALYERNTRIIAPALIAGGALVFSHVKKHHLQFSKYFLSAIAGSFFFALELVTSRLILGFYSPVSFYFLRCAAIFLVGFAVFRPDIGKLDKKVKMEILLVGAVWVIYRIIVYYGYLNFGVVFTTLLIMLAPIFVYLLAWKFLHEKINWKNIVASIIIVGCVIYAVS